MGFTDEGRIFYAHPSKLGYTLIIFFGYFALVLSISQNYSSRITETGCSLSSDINCLKCDIEGCVKCPELLIIDERRCVNSCPSGYLEQWSTNTNFLGRICKRKILSGSILATIAGLIVGLLICSMLITILVFSIKQKRRKRLIKEKLINENIIDRGDFLRQLNEIRPNAEHILAMLNDTRRQIRKLYLSGELEAANAYRPIVRDLAKLLILLNRPIELIPTPPHDWTRLYNWTECALERYKPQIGQLIDFFQTTTTSSDSDSRLQPYKNSTFRSTATTTSTLESRNFGSLISLHEFDEPRTSDTFGTSFTNTLKGRGSLISTDLHASSLWLEDEFFKLGFRPQDEITTEL